MPLLSGSSQKTISANISELTHHGSRPRSHDEIVAIALANADRTKRAEGGGVDLTYTPPPLPPFRRQPLSDIDPINRRRDEEPGPVGVVGDIGTTPYGPVWDGTAKYTHRVPFNDGGSANINAALRIARAGGGDVMPQMPGYERGEMRNIESSPYGLSIGTGGGRLDKNNLNVGAGSYVLPADVVAGLGDGNSLSGAHVWDTILSTMPWGITAPRPGPHRGPPQPPHNPAMMEGITGKQHEFARGGQGNNGGPPMEEEPEVPIVAADGEIIASPEHVLRVGQHYSSKRDLEAYPASHAKIMRRGHRVLDAFVKRERGKNIRKLKKLKGPVGSSEPHKGHI